MKEADVGICGLILLDESHRFAATYGMGTDPRIKIVVAEDDWLEAAAERRMVPIMLSERQILAFVTSVADGTLILLSDSPSDTVLNFFLSVDFAYDIINHVLTDPYDAMAIVDAKARLTFISPVHERFWGINPGQAIGKPVKDVIEGSRLPHVVRTGIAEVGQLHQMRGHERIVSRHPIRHNGKVVGAIGRIMFKGPQQVEALARRVNELEEKVALYQSESAEMAKADKFLGAIIGQSMAMQAVRQQLRKIAPLDIPVLIQGESGTGKELVAQALHMLSPRQDGRLVSVNAAALPESLVESELYGYEPGSFTGADRKGKAGKFQQADRGTIFLDEIGDMPLEVQTKLLRVLQDRMVERIGGEKPKRVDFRLCSATNRDLEQFVEMGKFRLDLFYRISPVRIDVPALRDRIEDIPLLITHFARDLAAQYGRPEPEIDLNVHEYLMEQQWPGNVRQLRHVIERAFVFAENNKLTIDDFRQGGPVQAVGGTAGKPAKPIPEASLSKNGGSIKEATDALELQLITDALIRFKGNKKKAAEHLAISRSYLYKRMQDLNLE